MVMNAVFLGVSVVLLATAGFWVFGRGVPRPTGTWAVGALLASFAVAFASYSPAVETEIEGAVPHIARLLSNAASLGAATSVLAVSFQLNLAPQEAARRIRRRLLLLGGVVLGLTMLFGVEVITHRSAQAYAAYLLVYLAYLGFAVVDFLRQAVGQARAAQRSSVRLGMGTAAAGCLFALVYIAYKTARLISVGLGLGLLPGATKCAGPLSGSCAFSVTAPAIAVLLICLGLTLPALVYPFTLARRRRWETQALQALTPMWQDLTAELPDIVLLRADDGGSEPTPDFLLQRRVIEISDALLALRPYRSRSHDEEARQQIDTTTRQGQAQLEAALIRGSLTAHRAGAVAEVLAEPSGAGPARGGDLRTETDWLVAVARAYRPLARVEAGLPC